MPPENQKESKQTGQQHSKTSVNHDPSTRLRSQFRFGADEYYYPQHRIPPQPLSFADSIGYLSVNTDKAPIQRFSLPIEDKTVQINNLKELYDNICYITSDKAFHEFYFELVEVEPILKLENIGVSDISVNSIDELYNNLQNLRDKLISKLTALDFDDIAGVCRHIYLNSPKATVDILTNLKKTDLNKLEAVINAKFKKYGTHICKSFKNDENFQFARAQFFHFGYDRSPLNREDIESDDIGERYDRSKSCVITALIYAEGRSKVFGMGDPEALHEVLFRYFSSYPGQDEEMDPNKKYNVWKNYSDDNVFPHLYKFFGYKSQKNNPNITDKKTLNDVLGILRSSNTKGIIIVEGHAIFFSAEGTFELKDNSDPQKTTMGILEENKDKKLHDIYSKDDITVATKSVAPKSVAPVGKSKSGKGSGGSKSPKSVPGRKKGK